MFGTFFSRFRNAKKSLEFGPVKRIDHIIINSADPEKLFDFFTKTLQLPVNWPFKDYGRFVCGGVFAGNAVLEILKWNKQPYVGPAYPQGLALEPWDLITSFATTKKRSIAMRTPFVNEGELPDGNKGRLYTNVGIPPLMDDGDVSFFCDYSPPIKEKKRRQVVEHGPSSNRALGVSAVSEVVFVQKDFEQVIENWEKFMAPLKPVDKGIWNISGIQLRFIASDNTAVRSITLHALSIEKAKSELNRLGVETSGISSTEIKLKSPELQGLQLFLKEDPSSKESNPYA
jgi:hypothetical protein